MVPVDIFGAGEVLAAMITPAVLISASGMLVLSTSNRLGRVVDRIRELTDLAEQLPDESPDERVAEKRALIADQVAWLTRRLLLLQRALVIFYASIGLLVGSSLTVGLSAAAHGTLNWVPIVLALGGATGLMSGAVILVLEARLAVHGTLNELDYVRKVVARKTTMRIKMEV
jgi:hypothetical protein